MFGGERIGGGDHRGRPCRADRGRDHAARDQRRVRAVGDIHDERAVRCGMHVEFENVCAHLRRILKRAERVFGIKTAAAAMREN